MPKTIIMSLLTFLLCACAPIPQNPQPFCHDSFLSIPVGKSAPDPISPDLPGHVDIVKVETRLVGQTLTATFHLKSMPEMLDVSRTGMPFPTVEYFYTVNINVDGTPVHGRNLSDYTLAAYHHIRNMDPASGPSELMLHPVLWKNSIDKDAATINFEEVSDRVGLEISSHHSTLSMTAVVPGINQDSTVLFVAEDFLAGSDGNSCEPAESNPRTPPTHT